MVTINTSILDVQGICADFLHAQLDLNYQAPGQITLVSKKPFCGNCAPILDQFQLDFPNIEIIRVDLQN